MRCIAIPATLVILAAGLPALGAGCHAHGPGGHAHGPDGEERPATTEAKESPAPRGVTEQNGRVTEWWGCYDGTQNIGTRRTTLRTMRAGGTELVVETDWFDGDVNNLVRIRGDQPHQADAVLVKTFSDGVVKREHTFERETAGGNIMIVRDRHNGDVRRVAVPANALTLPQVPHYLESTAFRGSDGATVTLLETEGGIATWSFTRRGTKQIRLHGQTREAAVIDGEGDAIDGHDHAAFYLVNGRVELIALGDQPVLMLRASRGGARQNLPRHPLDR